MSEEPAPTDRLLDVVSSMDAARQTLRWSLERIRALEASNAQLLRLLNRAPSEDDQAAAELETRLRSLFPEGADFRQLLEDRRRLENARFDVRAAELEAGYHAALTRVRQLYEERLDALEKLLAAKADPAPAPESPEPPPQDSLLDRGKRLVDQGKDLQEKAGQARSLLSSAAGYLPSGALHLAKGVGLWHLFGAALIGGLGVAGHHQLKNAGKDFALPSTHPSAIVWEGETLWISDWYDQEVFRLQEGARGLETSEKLMLPNVRASGLAVAGKRLYLADAAARAIQVRQLDPQLTLLKTVASPGASPAGLAFDGRSLWSIDEGSRRLYRHAVDEGLSVEESYALPFEPAGLYASKHGVWTGDAKERLIYRLEPGTEKLVAETFALPPAKSGSPVLAALAWRGEELWLAWQGYKTLWERPRSALKPVP